MFVCILISAKGPSASKMRTLGFYVGICLYGLGHEVPGSSGQGPGRFMKVHIGLLLSSCSIYAGLDNYNYGLGVS